MKKIDAFTEMNRMNENYDMGIANQDTFLKNYDNEYMELDEIFLNLNEYEAIKELGKL
tara:strand:+ start:3300 stop:3473 length:174 start_codon:yes stop_codon:yes gene_type:complete